MALETSTQPFVSRLGFAVKVLGRPGLKSNDSRRWQNNPHLRVSLENLHAIVDFLAEPGIQTFRFASEIAPYVTHPDMPRCHRQIEESATELAALGERLPRRDILVMLETKQKDLAPLRLCETVAAVGLE